MFHDLLLWVFCHPVLILDALLTLDLNLRITQITAKEAADAKMA